MCEDCREGAADRRGNKRKGKHGNKKVAADSKSGSKAIWVCLECGQYTCGGVGLPVTPQCHAIKHARQSQHPLVVNFDKPQLCWCFSCNMLIPDEKIEQNDETNHVLSDVVTLLKGQSSERSSVAVQDILLGDGSVTSKVKSGSLLVSDSTGKGGYIVRGMANLGNTCFFNSMTQNLLAMDRLRGNFLKLDAPFGPLMGSLKKLFTETNSESDGLSNEELAARKWDDSPKKDGTSSSISTVVDALFGGRLSSTVCCLECGHSSMVYEPFLDLSLPVPSKKPPARKAQVASQSKKTKLPLKKGGRTRVKVNRDAGPVPVQSLSTQLSNYESSCPVQSNISVAEEVVATSDDSTVLGSEKKSNLADKEDSTSPNILAVQDSKHMHALDNCSEKKSTLLGDFAWLDYVEAGTMADEGGFFSQKKDVKVIQDAESKDESLNESPLQASCESSGQNCFLDEEGNLRPDTLSRNGWEDEFPVQVQDSEVLLLPYKEESSSTPEIMGRDGEAMSSVLGCGQEDLGFDGLVTYLTSLKLLPGLHLDLHVVRLWKLETAVNLIQMK